MLGSEAPGTVDAVGPDVTGTSIGDGVAAPLSSLGGYAEYAVASLPEHIDLLSEAATAQLVRARLHGTQ